mgnify:CR=1 FL=1
MYELKIGKKNYKVQVYLGKEIYEKMERMAKFMGVPIATMTRIIINTGFELSSAMESNLIKGLQNVDKQSKE